jgi:hypothetical protein
MKLGVIAGTHQEFLEYVSRLFDYDPRKNNIQYFYVYSPSQIKEYRGQLVKVGTYYNREDIDEMEIAFEKCSTRNQIEQIQLEEGMDYDFDKDTFDGIFDDTINILPPKSASLSYDDLPF